MLTIRNHVIEQAVWLDTPNKSDVQIVPKFIVLHYTAGWGNAAAWFQNPAARASSQLLIERTGELTQMVHLNQKAWHAGPSYYDGHRNLNSHSIGIEIDNIGWLRHDGNGGYLDHRGQVVDPQRYQAAQFVDADHVRVGTGNFAWMLYTDEQINILDQVVQALLDQYPSIYDIVSHEEIDTRGWKTDPGPAFPMNRYKQMVAGRQDSPDQYTVVPRALNVRGGPGSEYDKLDDGPLSRGELVQLIRREGEWANIVLPAGQEGWVHASYIRRA